MLSLVLGLFAGFELKHFVADYLLQTGWMIAGKGSFAHPGGYAHAAVHALGSAIVLLIGRIPLTVVAALVVAEFVVHFLLDHAKVFYSGGTDPDKDPQRFWAMHGLDQLLHQVTYIAMVYVALHAVGAA
jgi:hypothetical protein